MRDLILVITLIGALVGIGCGVAQASDQSDLVQYRAQSPNYSLEYLSEDTQPGEPRVSGEESVQFEEQQRQHTPQATELPATNPPYIWIMAGMLALIIGFIAYLALK